MVRIAVKFLISVGLIILVLQGLDVSSVYSRIATTNTLSITISLVLLTGLALIHAERWRLVLIQLHIPMPAHTAIKIVLISYFFNQTLPSTVGGDTFRIWSVYKRGASPQTAVSSVVTDRIIALFSLLLMIVASSPWLLDLFRLPNSTWIFVISIVVGVISLVAILSNWLRILFSRWRVGRFLVSILVRTRTIFLNLRVLIFTVILTILGYVIVSFAVYLLAIGMSITLAFKDSLLLMPLVILVTILPVSIAGWGIREGAMVVSLGLVGVSAGEALALSLLFGILVLVSGIPGGLIWLVQHQQRSKERNDKMLPMGKNES